MKLKFTPSYENKIEVTTGTKNPVQVDKMSLVYVYGSDIYMEDYKVQISPDKTTWYTVGARFDDYNGNTQGTSFLFTIPAGWWFIDRCEGGFAYTIYPLTGEL